MDRGRGMVRRNAADRVRSDGVGRGRARAVRPMAQRTKARAELGNLFVQIRAVRQRIEWGDEDCEVAISAPAKLA